MVCAVDGRSTRLLLPIVELVTGSVPVAKICLCANADLLKLARKVRTGIVDSGTLLVSRLGGDAARDDDNLDRGNPGREDKTLVVSVDHDHDADRACGETPRVLPDESLGPAGGICRILDGDIEHLRAREVLSEAVRGRTLNSTAGGGDEALDGSCVETPGELLLLGLNAGDDGHGEELLVHSSVEVEDLEHLLVRFRLGQMRGVALLPQELASTEERLWVLELPTDDAVPLIELQWKVTVALNPLGIV